VTAPARRDDVAFAADGGVEVTTRVVTAERPDHVRHLDSRVIPTRAGVWVP